MQADINKTILLQINSLLQDETDRAGSDILQQNQFIESINRSATGTV